MYDFLSVVVFLFTLLFVCSGGSGLGLYIAAGVVNLHEGCKVWATSPGIGQGTTFLLQFPVAEAPLTADLALDMPPHDTPLATPADMNENVENLNILIAVRTLARLS